MHVRAHAATIVIQFLAHYPQLVLIRNLIFFFFL
jgi:hypothetical protein